MKTKRVIKITFILMVIMMVLILTVLVLFGQRPDTKPKNDIVRGALHEFVAAIEFTYIPEMGFRNPGCESPHTSQICKRIARYTQHQLTIQTTKEAYCLYIKLPVGKNYACVDISGASVVTLTSPGKTGYCDGVTFACPRQ